MNTSFFLVNDGMAGFSRDVARLPLSLMRPGVYTAEMLDLEADLEADLGIDSIKRVEIRGGLRERYPDAQEASPERLAELRTAL